jgi:2-amino-4-hydroxy-6-hydroxymethyldihydropteridine diphosphokinase
MRFCIALGSNLGDRRQHLREAANALRTLHQPTAPFLISRVYETEPVDCAPGDPGFLNAVVELESALEPLELLARLQAIEQQLGRAQEHGRNEPRTIDLDLLFAEGVSLNLPQLVLPHPRLTERRFVLAPLCDLRPDLQLPGWAGTAAELLAKLPAQPAATIFSEVL